jgi:hypothetical protein
VLYLLPFLASDPLLHSIITLPSPSVRRMEEVPKPKPAVPVPSHPHWFESWVYSL